MRKQQMNGQRTYIPFYDIIYENLFRGLQTKEEKQALYNGIFKQNIDLFNTKNLSKANFSSFSHFGKGKGASLKQKFNREDLTDTDIERMMHKKSLIMRRPTFIGYEGGEGSKILSRGQFG